MWYLVLSLFGCLLAYLYRALSRTSGSEFKDNSIDAFIIEDEDDKKPSYQVPKADKYKRDYETEGRQVLILFGTEYGFSEEISKVLFDRFLGPDNGPIKSLFLKLALWVAKDTNLLKMDSKESDQTELISGTNISQDDGSLVQIYTFTNFNFTKILDFYSLPYFNAELPDSQLLNIHCRILELNREECDSPFQPRLVNARDYQLIDLSHEHVVFIVISTSGDGVPPSDAREFYDFVLQNNLEYSHLEYSLLALGDSNYPQFCKTGRAIDARLLELGCKSVIRRHDVDMEDWSVVNNWLASVLDYLATVTIETKLDYLKLSDVTEEKYNRHHPFLATLKMKKQLTVCTDESDKETIHCEFDITGSELTWLSGDALGIYPRNNPPEVKRLLDAMKCSGTEVVDKPSWAYTCTWDHSREEERDWGLQSVLTHYYDMKSVRPELLFVIKDSVTKPEETARICELLKDGVSKTNSLLQNYLSDREVVDVLLDFKSHLLPWKQILGCMKSLQPRYYSISSSPKINSSTVCVTAAVLRYISHKIPRTGVTTTFLQDRLQVGETCPVFMSYNHDFRLPSNSQSPVILIGPGTGIAPFRAFIQERAVENSPGETVLYFGCRQRNKDYLYREELENWASECTITLRVAFSRDQTEKIYVHDLLYNDKQYLWKLINEEHAYIYICGDAKHMAHDVHTTLLKISQGEGHLSESEAETYLKTLEQECRYQKDVWVV